MYAAAAEAIKRSNTLLLVSHIHPDGDAVGSLTALGAALLADGKKVTLYNEHPVPSAYQFLPLSDTIVDDAGELDAYDVMIVLDCSKIERIGQLVDLIDKVPVIINIDHHCTNENFGGVQLVDPGACATTEIIYKLLVEMGSPINREAAYGIYTGIITDTASFSFENTSSGSFAICGKMVDLGVDPHLVSRNVYITYSLERIRFMKMVLSTFTLSEDKTISFMMGTQEMIRKSGMKPENVGRIVNYAKHIEGVKIAAMALEEEFREDHLPDHHHNFHVSLRSDGSVDVSKIAVFFGGGGHNSAAGFNITDTVEGLRETILGLSDNRIAGGYEQGAIKRNCCY
jgi:bifunctional oligoribonuclease and PAP phosphatase NrnA